MKLGKIVSLLGFYHLSNYLLSIHPFSSSVSKDVEDVEFKFSNAKQMISMNCTTHRKWYEVATNSKEVFIQVWNMSVWIIKSNEIVIGNIV